MNVPAIASMLRAFADERDWNQFHTPKNLAIAVSTEAAELLELFQWSKDQEQWKEFDEPDRRQRIEEEVADVLLYLIRFADLAQIDLEAACRKKVETNAKKYPVSLARGNSKKYDKLGNQ